MLTSFGLKPGDVFSWDNCPFRAKDDEPLKKRWFILLGYFVIEGQVLVVTTTTRFEHYGPGNPRANHIHFTLPLGAGGLSGIPLSIFRRIFKKFIYPGLKRVKPILQKPEP
jgi:hypothetical protein